LDFYSGKTREEVIEAWAASFFYWLCNRLPQGKRHRIRAKRATTQCHHCNPGKCLRATSL